MNFWMMAAMLVVPSLVFSETRFPSPKGIHEVGLEADDKRMYANPYARPLPPNTPTKLYRVNFYKGKSIFPAAQTYYTDIHLDPTSEFPKPLAQIAKDILWSPDELFAVMPYENWPEDKNRPLYRQAIGLQSDLPWQTADFRLHPKPLVWVNSSDVLGNASTACRLYVSAFEGKTGKTRLVEAGDESSGYEIISSTPEQVVMKKVRSQCVKDAPATGTPECMILDLRFDRRQIAACPK